MDDQVRDRIDGWDEREDVRDGLWKIREDLYDKFDRIRTINMAEFEWKNDQKRIHCSKFESELMLQKGTPDGPRIGFTKNLSAWAGGKRDVGEEWRW